MQTNGTVTEVPVFITVFRVYPFAVVLYTQLTEPETVKTNLLYKQWKLFNCIFGCRYQRIHMLVRSNIFHVTLVFEISLRNVKQSNCNHTMTSGHRH